ncbi:uncharacterized protein DEA37_0012895 [Paragonimus westermani]|uniref:Protein SZT2 n=1 Tax=Paragonimus westermani TaxID=34504 RepID=A0A5J4NJG6_9TREM|nr:uncharacterized protein DEA37_0012895 [Paragonimus westermani]
MDSTRHRINKFYILPRQRIVPCEVLSEWFVSHFGCPFVYDPEKRVFFPKCREYAEHTDCSDLCKHSLFQLVSVSPFNPHSMGFYVYDMNTESRCFQTSYKFTFVIDWSFSLLSPNSSGKCGLSDVIDALRTLLEQMTTDQPLLLPGSKFCLPEITPIVTVIVVVPGLQCYTLVAGWSVRHEGISAKISMFKKVLSKIGRKLIERSQQSSSPRAGNKCNFLVDLLKHGILAASFVASDMETSSVIILTDGAFSVNNLEVLDRSLTHLKAERIRCSFVLLNSELPPSNSCAVEGSALNYVVQSNSCVPQVELCSFLVQSTDGFLLSAHTDLTHFHDVRERNLWNVLKEALFTIPITSTMHVDNLPGDLNWVPLGTLQTQNKLVRAPMFTVLTARLRDGYKLRLVEPISGISKVFEPTGNSLPSADFLEPFEEPNLRAPDYAVNVIQLELELPWKIGIVFHVGIRGVWREFHEKTYECGQFSLSEVEPKRMQYPNDSFRTKHSNLRPATSSCSQVSQWAWNRQTSQTYFKISASYSLLNEIVRRPQRVHRTDVSLYNRFVTYHRHLSMTDQQLEHLTKFSHAKHVLNVPEALSSRLVAAFSLFTDSSGRQIGMPNQSHNTTLHCALNSQFSHYWRLFLELNPLECYRWMSVHNLYGILEHDSQLPFNLHLPTEGTSYTVSLTCRQSLDRLHALLASWCSFVLLENSTYVRFLCTAHCEHVGTLTEAHSDSHTHNQLSSSSNQQENTESLVSEHSFCIVRLETILPEFRLRIGFVSGTAMRVQQELVQYLRTQLNALRFPPRGRQAIPKSRHKSGAPPAATEAKHVPPLQRSWEDTPCCHVFHSRLDRLILNAGFWSRRLFVDTDSKLSRPTHSHQGSLLTAKNKSRATSQQRNFVTYPVIAPPRPSLGPALVKQHLHHRSRMWVIQPIPLATDGLRTLFSSLVNLRLQEGFHLVRVGPQPGFISLATELWLAVDRSFIPQPCLIQYLLYPFDEWGVDDVNMAVGVDSLAPLNGSLRNAVSRVRHEHKTRCEHINRMDGDRCIPVCKMTLDEATCISSYPFRLVQVMTEVWTQPVEGRIVDPPQEITHWTGLRFEEIAKRIFTVDERCVVSYVTFERLCTILKTVVSPVYMPRLVPTSTCVPCTVGCVDPELDVYWAPSDIIALLALAPQNTILCPLLSSTATQKNSEQLNDSVFANEQCNDRLLSELCSSILNKRSMVEIHLAVDDFKYYILHLCQRVGLSKTDTELSSYPNWRCFVGSGGLMWENIPRSVAPDADNSNAVITVLFLPATTRDVAHPVLRAILSKQLNGARWNFPKVPLFFYTCSRSYLSYLIVDSWTYKVPPDYIFNLSHPSADDGDLIDTLEHNISASSPFPTAPPNDFLNVGCQNTRLTPELNVMWSASRSAIDFVSRAHLNAYALTVYHCLSIMHSIEERDFRYILNASQRGPPDQHFSIDLTSFVLCTCEHLLSPIRRKHAEFGTEYRTYENDFTVLLNQEQWSSSSQEERRLQVQLETVHRESTCTDCRSHLFSQLFDCYTYPVPGYSGIFAIKSRQVNPRGSLKVPCHVRTTANMFHSTNIESAAHFTEDPSVFAVHPNASESDEGDTSETSVLSNQVLSSSTKRSASQLSSDPLILNVGKWFRESSSGAQLPLFVQIRASLTYGTESINLPLWNGLPLFCIANFYSSLLSVVNKVQNESHSASSVVLELDLSLLHCRLEVMPLVWCSGSSALIEPDTVCTHPLFPSPSQFHCHTLAADEVFQTIDSWVTHNEGSLFNCFQRTVLCSFLFRLAWEMEKEIVISLRTITPVTESTAQLVLRHIEDTQKLSRTPLFDELKLNGTNSHPLNKDMVLSSSDDNQVCSNESRNSIKCPMKDRSHSSAVFDLNHPKESILISRVRLDFVSYSSAVFSHFLNRFEHLSFSSVGACLHRLNDYYFLKSADSTSDREYHERSGERIRAVHSSHRGRFVRYPSDKQGLSLPLSDPEVSGVLTDTSSKTEFSRKANTSKPTTIPSRSRPQNHFNSFDKPLESQQQNPLALTKHSNFGVQFTLHSQGYEGDSSEASEENVLRTTTLRSRLTEQHSTHEKGTLMRTWVAHEKANQQNYSLPPYWLFFRLCSNSVTLFFHHPDTHCQQDRCGVNPRHVYRQLVLSSFGHTRYTSTQSARSLQHCPFCMAFQIVVKQINSVIRLVNQRLLLDKLRNERMCDVLLLAPPKDPGSSDANAKDVWNHIPIPGRTTRKSDGHKLTRSKQWEPNHTTLHRTSESYRSSEQAGTEGEKPFDNLKKKKDRLVCCTTVENDHILVSDASYSAHQANILSKRASLSSSGWAQSPQPPNWCPGCFACPVQLNDRIRLHPRVFLAAGATQGIVGPPMDRGQRVVAALRKLLDKPSIYNQPNMFFVIDFTPPSATLLNSESKRKSTAKPSSSTLGPRVCFDADAVFYMLLEVTTERPKTSSAGSPVHSLLNETDSLQSSSRPSEELKVTELSGGPDHPLDLAHVSRLPSVACDKVEVEHFLQITLHGIEKPSRQLCNSVREMLQVRLDSLVLEHFSDSLSRNAISRLSAADLNFLISRRWQCPKSHCLIALPRFFCTTTDWQPALPYVPGRLILALCHYLKQNLSLFLHAVKLDREAVLCNASEMVELFLYNRPRAHGVAKPGVATLLFQLLTKCTSDDGSTGKQYFSPHTIADWSLPQEFLPQVTKNNFTIPSFNDLYTAVTDFTEFSQSNLLSFGPSQLVLSIQIWERGDADIENLKCRLKTTVLHSLYDLITEFFVLTAPIKLPRTTTSGTSATMTVDQYKPTTNEFAADVSHGISTDNVYRLNPYISSVVLPWFKQGFDFESPLVLKITLQLTSISCLAQLIGDLLRPFNNSLYNTEDFFPPIRSPMTSGPFGLNPNTSVAGVPVASSSPNVKFGSCSLSGVTFHLFVQGNADGIVYYPIGMDKLQLAGRLLRPGEMGNYLIIGRNFSAWRQLIRGQRRTFSGAVSRDGVETTTVCSPVELRSQSTKYLPNQSVDRLKPEMNLPSPMECDELLRMQSLYMTLSLPTPGSTALTSKTELEDRSGKSGDCFSEFPSDNVRVSCKSTPSTITNEPSSSGTPVCKFPEFCPITFGLSPSVAPLSPSSKPSWGSGPSVDRSTSSASRHEVTSGAASRPTEKPLTVLVPRQTFCLFVIEGRQITLYTYNWAKEEAERLAGRLTTLVEWHNSRFKLLSMLSMQKLGLFHNLDESVSRRYASRAVSLVYNTCPPELTTAMESGSIGSVGNLLDRQTTPVNFPVSTAPSGSNIGASVSGASKLFPATRRRYPTSGGIDSGTTVASTACAAFHPFSPLSSVSHLGIKLPELDAVSVNHFSHLFQDCGRIPPLEETGSMDLVYRHGRQALVTIEADRLRAHQLELLSLPFRAWQEGRKRKQAGEYCTDTATSKLIETPSRSSNGANRCGAMNAEAALSNDPLSKRLKRFSSIRLACRHLHTICTPILFCPSTRAQVVRSVQIENRTLRRVAEACYQAQQETDRSSKDPPDSQNIDVCSQALFHWSSLGNDLRDLVGSPSVSRLHSSVSDSVHPFTSPLSGVTVQPHPNNAQPAIQSPWLSWSRSELLDTLNELTNPHPISDNSTVTRQVVVGSNTLADASFTATESVIQTTDWVRRTALSFLASYTQYIQHGVGFRVIPITEQNPLGSAVIANKNTVKPTGSYVLLHRAIHLAGVHIMEIFIRHSHLYVRLGTIELSRFSRHASRGLITGPLSAEVITQAAASAAVTAASVRRDAATSIRRDAANVVPGSETRSRAMMDVFESKSRRFEHQQHSSGFSWDESSRLCDYTHVHSFSYDYYIRAVYDYLINQRSQRRPSFGVPTRKSSHSKHTVHTTTDAFGITDFPVAEFLADIHVLVHQPPVFARSCLRAVQLACPVSAYLRPAQVFHHLIEEHQNYHIQIVRMLRTVCDHPQLIGTQPRQISTSYTFGILELHPADAPARLPGIHHHLSRQSSHTEFDVPTKAQPDFVHIAGSGVSGPSAIVLPGSNNDQPTSNSSRYSIAALVIADDHRNAGSLSTPLEAADRLLHLTIYLLATDPHSPFPKSRLACVQDLSYSSAKRPVEWPACAPFHDPEAELPSAYHATTTALHGLPRALSIENGDVVCALNLSAVSRNRHTSITETSQTEPRPTPATVVSVAESTTNMSQDYRWHVSYLGMWPSHHVSIHRAIEAAQSHLQTRVIHLVEQSGLDCHKNLLWYRLFDSQHLLQKCATPEPLSPASLNKPLDALASQSPSGSVSVSSDRIDTLDHEQLTFSEIEELVQSAPFELDVLRLDERLLRTLLVGASHLNQVAHLINSQFAIAGLGTGDQTSKASAAVLGGHLKQESNLFVCCFRQNSENTDGNYDDNAPDWVKHQMALLSPNFTDGFVLLSWSECIPELNGGPVHTFKC